MSLTYELYANMYEHHDSVFVRGVKLTFTTDEINRSLSILLMGRNSVEYLAFLRSEIDYVVVVEKLCFKGAPWMRSGNQPRSLASY